ncbi:hypothetical protein Peur_012761 [Populus x canadensis]
MDTMLQTILLKKLKDFGYLYYPRNENAEGSQSPPMQLLWCMRYQEMKEFPFRPSGENPTQSISSNLCKNGNGREAFQSRAHFTSAKQGGHFASLPFCGFVSSVFLLPTYYPISWDTFNYAPVALVAGLILIMLWRVLDARELFKGPVRNIDIPNGKV